ncbi:3-oxoacyl-[acyl-carrier protein] reductase [Branchiibius hedensis]|uniref:3-oxoacyl-[acyl-carrier protein] reductase n=1 Tax=Branchiibius hedensis TaxID=672460 RepID=A0A2Y8ZPB4_9MICO|nr:3-oxoacyl-ACP reductase FabG [Branchiibius hedensis]PWJ24858.1 3-oxoacyl-[acyl-carrier protein] reductase [Branchiibius hedensis]SSA33674.1 3-oxoacyl-[acyl-carrier protein] reductase [Branchiibius hedensis]
MTNLLTDKVAVITGGAQGIGEAIARRFADQGAFVVLGDRDGAAAELTAKAIGEDFARGFGCDVTNGEQVEALLQFAVESFGGVDVMVNNAGITRDATMKKMTEDEFDQVVAVHLRGAWLGTKHAAAVLREQGRGGSIVNMSSISAKVGFFGQTNYSAAKAGVVGLTKAAAKELARDNVRVNAIQPGLISTEMTRAMPEHIWESKMAEIPLQRAGTVEEIADVALFLASDMSSYMTGTVLEVTGGRLM